MTRRGALIFSVFFLGACAVGAAVGVLIGLAADVAVELAEADFRKSR